MSECTKCEATEVRAKQDIALARDEADYARSTLSHEVWSNVKDCFTELLDPSIDISALPPKARLWAKRVKQIHRELVSVGIAPNENKS